MRLSFPLARKMFQFARLSLACSRIQDTGLTIQEKATQRVSQKNLEGNPSCSKNAFAILNAVPNTYYYEIASKK